MKTTLLAAAALIGLAANAPARAGEGGAHDAPAPQPVYSMVQTGAQGHEALGAFAGPGQPVTGAYAPVVLALGGHGREAEPSFSTPPALRSVDVAFASASLAR